MGVFVGHTVDDFVVEVYPFVDLTASFPDVVVTCCDPCVEIGDVPVGEDCRGARVGEELGRFPAARGETGQFLHALVDGGCRLLSEHGLGGFGLNFEGSQEVNLCDQVGHEVLLVNCVEATPVDCGAGDERVEGLALLLVVGLAEVEAVGAAACRVDLVGPVDQLLEVRREHVGVVLGGAVLFGQQVLAGLPPPISDPLTTFGLIVPVEPTSPVGEVQPPGEVVLLAGFGVAVELILDAEVVVHLNT